MNDASEVRFGVIGVGRIAKNRFAPALATVPGVRLTAAASRDLDNAKSIGAERAYDRYEALLEDKNVDAVYIATHNGLHRSLAIKALEHGKHVLCEKPLARNATECEEVVKAAHKHRRILVEAFMYRHHPQIRRAWQLVDSGAIGELKVVETAFSFKLQSENDVRLNPEWGGGGLLDVGCYCVNACRLFLGNEPRKIQALGSFHPQHDVDMSLHGVLYFGEGRYGVVSCGFDSGLRNHLCLSGTEGSIFLPRAFLSWAIDPVLILEQGENHREEITFDKVDVFALEIADFAEAVRTGRQPLLPPDDGLHNARILDALLAAARRP